MVVVQLQGRLGVSQGHLRQLMVGAEAAMACSLVELGAHQGLKLQQQQRPPLRRQPLLSPQEGRPMLL